MEDRRPNVIFWSGLLLPPSETFVRAQARAMRRFAPQFAGVRSYGSSSLIPSEDCLLVNRGGIAGTIGEQWFKLTGIAPGFRRALGCLRPALIHAHHGVSGALALPLARALGVPLIVTFYGADATVARPAGHSPTQWVFRRRAEQLRRDTILFIAVSEFIRGKLIECGYPAEKIIAHYYGVDTQEFQADRAIAREPVVLFVGRLAEKKGCEYLIRAMQRVQAAMGQWRLVIIGDGPLRASLETLAASSLRQCSFLGLQPTSVVRDWMNRSSILAVPSVTAASGDSEGLPTVLIEGQALGLPVVASHHAGIPEAVTDGQTGLLAPERDVMKLAEHILRLCSDPLLWSSISIHARRQVERRYDLRTQTRILEDLYAGTEHRLLRQGLGRRPHEQQPHHAPAGPG